MSAGVQTIPPQIRAMLETGSDVVFSLSGGKDSTATYLHAMELGVHDLAAQHGGRVLRVFADTGWELPETYAYLDQLEEKIGPIDRVALWVPGPGEDQPAGYHTLVPVWVTDRGGDGGVMHGDRWAFARIIETRLGHYSPLIRLMMEWRKVPTTVRRWCTMDTKQRPIVEYLATTGDPVNVIGVRAEESARRATMEPIEWSDDFDALTWRAIHDWPVDRVYAIHRRHGLEPNPLYLQGQGAGRVGCGPCVYSGDEDIRWLTEFHRDRLDILAEVERLIRELDPPRLSAGFDAPQWFRLRQNGTNVSIPVEEAIRYASLDLGGSAPLLLAPQRAPGCAKWGLCSWG